MLLLAEISCNPKLGHFTRDYDGSTESLSLLNSHEFVYEMRTGRDKLVARGDYIRFDTMVRIEITSLLGNPLLLPAQLLHCEVQESSSPETSLVLKDRQFEEPLLFIPTRLTSVSGQVMESHTDLSGELVYHDADLKDIAVAPTGCLPSKISFADTGYWNIQCGMICIPLPSDDATCFGPETLMLLVTVDTIRKTIVDIRQ